MVQTEPIPMSQWHPTEHLSLPRLQAITHVSLDVLACNIMMNVHLNHAHVPGYQTIRQLSISACQGILLLTAGAEFSYAQCSQKGVAVQQAPHEVARVLPYHEAELLILQAPLIPPPCIAQSHYTEDVAAKQLAVL